ncbi:MAG TPA: GNAT family N-acetyltransferase [Rubrivivax sp.]|nr:GNAT family N-acetyltransferase [Rubrivivax sp.]
MSSAAGAALPSVLRFRLATPADVPALAGLYAHCARELGPQVYSAEQVLAWQGFAHDAPAFADYVLQARTWMAEDAEGPLGFCGIDANGEVRSLYVRAAAMRKGLGSALLAQALASARQQGVAAFAAWATPFSLPVFTRAGFTLQRSVHEPFQGVMFERHRMALA